MGLGTLASALLVSPALVLLAVPVGSYVVWSLLAYLLSPIKGYPGPFLAKWTNLWRLYYVSRGDFHHHLQKLHSDYGPVVRVGPNIVDVDLPSVVKTAFSMKEEWRKTEFYHGSSALVNGKVVYNLFSEIDPQQHARERKPISKYYSMSSIFPLEPHMDNVLNQLCQQLETRFIGGQNVGKPANIGEWLLFYSWDAVGAVTFSQPIGYLANGHDFDKTLTNSEKAMDYFSVVGTMPFLDYVFDKNPVVRLGPPGFGTITTISLRHLVDRYQGNDKDYHDPSKPDFLDRFIEVKNANPDTVNDPQIISWLMINMIAGADTTAITIRSALYYSLRTPGVWTRLRSELAAAGLTKDRCPIQYRDCRSVAYLDAIVREALRILPGVSLSLERYVPASGCHLPDGSFLPGGTIVGLNPYLLARNREVWGDDAESFRPERWFRGAGEGEEAFQARLRAMNDADLSFGGGRRICIGKNMGLIQVFKVVATLVTLYDMELVDPEKEWKVTNSWFPRQEGLEVKLSKREW